jgi:hypothetical protein
MAIILGVNKIVLKLKKNSYRGILYIPDLVLTEIKKIKALIYTADKES